MRAEEKRRPSIVEIKEAARVRFEVLVQENGSKVPVVVLSKRRLGWVEFRNELRAEFRKAIAEAILDMASTQEQRRQLRAEWFGKDFGKDEKTKPPAPAPLPSARVVSSPLSRLWSSIRRFLRRNP